LCSIGGFKLGQCSQGEAKLANAPVQFGDDFATPPVCIHQATPKLTGPAESRAISNVTSPSCAPAYSSDVIWKSPEMMPKSGIAICQLAISPAKNFARIRASDCESLKMPLPLTAARCTPLPASSSRHLPAESASVISTVSLLKAMRFVRSPATVT